jgi:hypothetical protein
MRAAVLTALLATALVAADVSRARVGSLSCPRDPAATLYLRPTAYPLLLAAVRRDVPRFFAGLTSMGSPGWPGYQLVGIFPLGGQLYPEPNFVKSRRLLATRLCGRDVAAVTVDIELQFPNCQIPCSRGYLFFALTRRGWRAWYPPPIPKIR